MRALSQPSIAFPTRHWIVLPDAALNLETRTAQWKTHPGDMVFEAEGRLSLSTAESANYSVVRCASEALGVASTNLGMKAKYVSGQAQLHHAVRRSAAGVEPSSTCRRSTSGEQIPVKGEEEGKGVVCSPSILTGKG